jgi:hypothetical protein
MIFASVFGIVAAVMLIVAVGSVVRGWVLTMLWAWFVVPTFGAQPLEIAPAIGCALVVSYLTHQPGPTNESAGNLEDVFGRLIGHTMLVPFIALGFGWIVKQWM